MSLYVHIPWCVRKCPYCDFNSHPLGKTLPEDAYVTALIADFEQTSQPLGKRPIDSVFIGGGTPSLFSPEALERLLSGIAAHASLAPDLEITLEANPGTAESGRFKAFRALGITRLSIGVQSFQDEQLRALGRIHSAAEAVCAIEMAHSAGFDNINIDLMFGLPEQSRPRAVSDVRKAVQLAPAHISYYQLTLEPNTLYYSRPPRLPSDDAIGSIQQAGQAYLAQHGYRQYEISAYALPGRQCRHNVNYWQFGDYLGIGAGAHGKLTDIRQDSIVRTWKVKHPAHYMQTAGTPACIGGRRAIPPHDRVLEFVMNHLRLREGFSADQFSRRTGLPLSHLEPTLSACIEHDWLERRASRIRCTELGWRFLDDVLARFIPG